MHQGNIGDGHAPGNQQSKGHLNDSLSIFLTDFRCFHFQPIKGFGRQTHEKRLISYKDAFLKHNRSVKDEKD